MKKTLCIVVLLFMTTISMGALVNDRLENTLPLPDGKWGFSAHPYLGEGYESRPVVVTSVKTEKNNLSVTAVKVRNISSKSVTAVRLAWILFTEGKRDLLLLEGETPIIAINKGLATDKAEVLQFPVVSFAEISKSLPKEKQLEGDYRLEVFVKEILFEDRSSWQVGQKVAVRNQLSNVSVVKASFPKKMEPLVVTPLSTALQCPMQACKYVTGIPSYYTCDTSANNEYCTNCVSTCCNTICSDPSPACGPCT